MKKILVLSILSACFCTAAFSQRKEKEQQKWVELKLNFQYSEKNGLGIAGRGIAGVRQFGVDAGANLDGSGVVILGLGYPLHVIYKTNPEKKEVEEKLFIMPTFYVFANTFTGAGPGLFAQYERKKFNLDLTSQIGIKNSGEELYNLNIVVATLKFKKWDFGIESEARYENFAVNPQSDRGMHTEERTLESFIGPLIKLRSGIITFEGSYLKNIQGGDSKISISFLTGTQKN
jgi:hypothetical protein